MANRQVVHYALLTTRNGEEVVISPCNGNLIARVSSIPSFVTCAKCKELGFGR